MVDSNYNMIKPIEALQNITGLTQVKQRKERDRQEKQKKSSQHEHEQMPDESVEIDAENEIDEQQNDPHSIDYCA